MNEQEAKEQGFNVDKSTYPWTAYKGPRFTPTDVQAIETPRWSNTMDAESEEFPFKPGDQVTVDQLQAMFPDAVFVGLDRAEPPPAPWVTTDLTADPEGWNKVTLWIDVTQVIGPRDSDGLVPMDTIQSYPVLSLPMPLWNELVLRAGAGGEGELEGMAAGMVELMQLNLYSVDVDEGRIHPDVPFKGIGAMNEGDEDGWEGYASPGSDNYGSLT